VSLDDDDGGGAEVVVGVGVLAGEEDDSVPYNGLPP